MNPQMARPPQRDFRKTWDAVAYCLRAQPTAFIEDRAVMRLIYKTAVFSRTLSSIRRRVLTINEMFKGLGCLESLESITFRVAIIFNRWTKLETLTLHSRHSSIDIL